MANYGLRISMCINPPALAKLFGKYVLQTLLMLIVVCTQLNAQRIVCTRYSASMLCDNGIVYSWGDNSFGQLGDGTLTLRETPVETIGLNNVVRLATGKFRVAGATYAIKNDGTVWVFGGWSNDNEFNILNWPNLHSTPIQIPFAQNIVTIGIGDANKYFVQNNGNVIATGANRFYGYANNTDSTLSEVPAEVQIDSVVQITTAYLDAYAIRRDGYVWSWGSNRDKNTSEGDSIIVKVPTKREGTFPAKEILASQGERNIRTSVVLLLSTDSVVVWGGNKTGHLGLGHTRHVKSPTKLESIGKVQQIAVGYDHTLFLKPDGSVWACGENYRGQLGVADIEYSTIPIQVPGINNVVEIAAGGENSFALTRDGKLWGWGSNSNRLLQDGTTIHRAYPVQIPKPCEFTSIKELAPFKAEQVSLFPNPVSDVLTVKFGDNLITSKELVVHAVTTLGERFSLVATVNQNSVVVDIRLLNSGTYYLQVVDGAVNYRAIFIVVK
jgi:alpha-tubulin suppressor-like RCC1 family protein